MNKWQKRYPLLLVFCATLFSFSILSDAADDELGTEPEGAIEDNAEVKLVPPRFVGQTFDIEFNFPIIGKVVLRAVKGASGREGMQGVFTFPKNPVSIGPLSINNKGSLTLVDGVLSFTGSAQLDLGGKKWRATIGLREVVFDSEKDTESDEFSGGEPRRVRFIESCRFGIELEGGAKDLELIPGVPLAIKSLDLLLTSFSAPALEIRGFVAGSAVSLMATLDLKNKSLSLHGMLDQCRLANIAPFLKNTILEHFSFGGAFDISTTGQVHIEGHIYGKTKKDKASIELFPGIAGSFDSITFDYKKPPAIGEFMTSGQTRRSKVPPVVEIKMKSTFLGAGFEYTGNYNFKTKALVLSAKMNQLKLADLIPQVRTSELKDIVFDANASISSGGTVSFRGTASNTSEKSFYGFKFKKIIVGLNTQKKAGFVRGLADMLNLPLAALFSISWGKKPGIFISAGLDESLTAWQPFSLFPKTDEHLEFIRTMEIIEPKLRISAGLAKSDKGKQVRRKRTIWRRKRATTRREEKKMRRREEELRKRGVLREITPIKPAMPGVPGKGRGFLEEFDRYENPTDDLVEMEVNENRLLGISEGEFEEEYLSIDELKEEGTHISCVVGGKILGGKLLSEAIKQIGSLTKLDPKVLSAISMKDIEIEGLFKIGLASRGKLSIVGLLGLPKGFGLTDLLPARDVFVSAFKKKEEGELLYEILDFVKLDYGKIIVSLKDEVIDGIAYHTGISLDTNVAVGQGIQTALLKKLHSIKVMKEFFDKKGERGLGARFLVNFNPLDPKNLLVSIGLTTGDFTFSIPKLRYPPNAPVLDIGPYDFSNLALNFVIRGTSLGLEAAFQFLPHEDPEQKPITFGGGFKATENAIGGELYGAGIWSNPFGIAKIFRNGFTIGDLGFYLSETYENIGNIVDTFGLSLLLGHLGLSGKVSVGSTKKFSLDAFLKVGGDFMDEAFEFRLTGLHNLVDILQGFAEQTGLASQLKVDLNTAVLGELDELYLKFAPLGANIGAIQVSNGIGGALHGKLFGAPIGAEMEVTLSSIKMRGYLPDIKIGPLIITKAGGKGVEIQEIIKKYLKTHAPAAIGPEFDFVLSLQELPRLKINGEMRLDLPNNTTLFKTMADIELSVKRFAFETETLIGPPAANIRGHIKASTIELGEPLKMLSQIQPDKLSLEVNFSDTLSKEVHKEIDKAFVKFTTELNTTIDQLSAQVGKKTSDAEVNAIDAAYKKAMGEKQAFDVIINWIKLRYLTAKRDLEKLDILGLEDFMRKIGLTKILQSIIRGLGDVSMELFKEGKFSFDTITKLMTIDKVAWKGTVADLAKGKIPGVEVDITIRGKKYHKNVGDLDFTSIDKLNWSIAQISLSAAQLAGALIGEILGVNINVPACAPSVLVEFQNQREDLAIKVKDTNNIETTIPWWEKRAYVQADILCQKRTDQLKPKESPDASNTYLLYANGKVAARITCAYGPLGKEGITARIEEATANGKFVERMTQVNWGEKRIDLAPPEVAPFTFKVIIIREGIQSKIKFYIQELFENCGAKFYLEAVNQIPGIKVVIADEKHKRITIPHTSQRAWIRVDGLCRSDTQPVTKKYTVSVQDQAVADVTCTFGPANHEFMEATITKAAGVKSSVATVSKRDLGQVNLPFKLPGLGRLLLKVEMVKESTKGVYQSKFKIYIQDLKECGAQAWVEVQNQVYGSHVTLEDAYEKRVDIPSWDIKNYVTLDPICQSRAEVAEPLSIYLEGEKVAEVICSFGPEEHETVRAKIIRFGPDGKANGEKVGKNYERIEMPLTT